MKLVFRKARKTEKTSAAHDDRTFLRGHKDDPSFAEHIDRERVRDNKILLNDEMRAIYDEHKSDRWTTEQCELEFYRRHFGQSLDAKNAHYAEKGSTQKIKTMEQYYKSRTGKPEELILQLGDKDDHPDNIYKEVKAATRELKKRGFTVLSVYIHMDETTPHAHIRGIFIGRDSRGYEEVSQSHALRDHGYERPDMSRPPGQDNSPLMSWTADVRSALEQLYIGMGYDLDLERAPKRRHLNAEEYKEWKETQEQLETMHTELESAREQIAGMRAEIDGLRGQRDAEAERLTAETERIEAQLAQLEAQYDTASRDLRQRYAAEKAQLDERRTQLRSQETALEGRELKLDEVKSLQTKRVWSAEDKRDVIKTAIAGATHAQGERRATRDLTAEREHSADLQRQLTASQRRVDELEAQVDTSMTATILQAKVESQAHEMERLRATLREHGLNEPHPDHGIRMR